MTMSRMNPELFLAVTGPWPRFSLGAGKLNFASFVDVFLPVFILFSLISKVCLS